VYGYSVNPPGASSDFFLAFGPIWAVFCRANEKLPIKVPFFFQTLFSLVKYTQKCERGIKKTTQKESEWLGCVFWGGPNGGGHTPFLTRIARTARKRVEWYPIVVVLHRATTRVSTSLVLVCLISNKATLRRFCATVCVLNACSKFDACKSKWVTFVFKTPHMQWEDRHTVM